MRGLVIRNTGSWYVVRTDNGQLVDSKIKGSFRLKGIRSTNPVAVGDYVQITCTAEGTAFITEIEERKNYIIRKASNLSKQSHIIAANVDQVLLLITISHPETSTIFIDRFLASAEAYRIPVILAFNKTDCYTEEEKKYMSELMRLYEHIGYDCIACSALQETGMEKISNLLKGKTTLLSGNSGVGKSTLLNTLIPGLNARTAEISSAHDTGMHTTTFSEMFNLPESGCVIDTPGIKGFGTFDFKKEEVGHYFKEIFRESANCKYGDCTHTHEPGCAVRHAIEEGRISQSRYASYLNMLEDPDETKYRQAY